MTQPIAYPIDALLEAWRSHTPDEQLPEFQSLDRGSAGDFFLRLRTEERAEQEQRVWLRLLELDDVADLLQTLPEDHRDSIVALLDPRGRAQVAALLVYRDDVGGGRMNPRYVRVRPEMTVDQALAYMRLQATGQELIYYAYVLDVEGRLEGVVSFRDLILASAPACSGSHAFRGGLGS